MSVNESFVTILAELRRMFGLLNEHYFGGQLVEPVITIQTNSGINKYTRGWFESRCWYENELKEHACEITICGEYLYRNPNEIMCTLLHEMVHLYCAMHDIKDTSRSGFYHNKRYKAAAEAHGLICTKSEDSGFNVTRLTEEAQAFITANVNPDAFGLTRSAYLPEENADAVDNSDGDGADTLQEKKKRKKYIYKCPNCGIEFKLSLEHKLICGDCNVLMDCKSQLPATYG